MDMEEGKAQEPIGGPTCDHAVIEDGIHSNSGKQHISHSVMPFREIKVEPLAECQRTDQHQKDNINCSVACQIGLCFAEHWLFPPAIIADALYCKNYRSGHKEIEGGETEVVRNTSFVRGDNSAGYNQKA